MRVLLPFLILLNIGFFYWASYQELVQISAPLGKKVLDYTTLQTVSERDNPVEVLSSSMQGNELQLITRHSQCSSLGPFTSVSALDETYNQIVNAGVDATQKTIQQRVPKSYWVYLEPHSSLDSAYETIAYLEDKKVKEHFIMRAPEEKRFSISLGLFSELSPANKLMKKIAEIDLLPKLEIRFDDITEYWIHYRELSENEELDVLENILQKNEQLLVTESDC